ncbi:MAG: LPS export ABC transporter periplasmic protein LptC [Gammaproteobacteria bacterium]|nr:LPS export ABC transporter periplasmic protein LptC [Gammaproteobacteria bacterium]
MNRKNLLIAAFALLLVLLGNWLAEQGVKRVDKALAPEPLVQRDYYLNDVTITELDEQGQPQHRLQARQLNHFSATEQTELQQPDLEIFEKNKVIWHVMADHGRLDQLHDEVLLQGKVRLTQSGVQAPLRLTTPALRIQPKRGRAETDQPVTLTQGNSRVRAVGMQLEQPEQRLLLLSQVRGRYEAPAP